MRWGKHLLTALIVGALMVGIWEIYYGGSFGELLLKFLENLDIGTPVAILVFVVIILWFKASRG